jgi:hypothetical protein
MLHGDQGAHRDTSNIALQNIVPAVQKHTVYEKIERKLEQVACLRSLGFDDALCARERLECLLS